MSMSARDYKMIAACIKQVKRVHPDELAGIAAVADALAADFAHDNPQFKRGMFMAACDLLLLS